MAGNPLLSMMGGNNPMAAMMQNSPIGKMISLMKSGGNPQALVQQMMGQNKEFGNLINSLNGKDQSQVNDMLAKAANQKGINLTELAKNIGLPPDIAKNFNINID